MNLLIDLTYRTYQSYLDYDQDVADKLANLRDIEVNVIQAQNEILIWVKSFFLLSPQTNVKLACDKNELSF